MVYDVFQQIGVSETGRGESHQIKVPYVVIGTNKQHTARDLIFRHIGPKVFGMEIDNIEVTETGPSQWEGSVDLKGFKRKENIFGLQSISFDTGGGSMTIQNGKLVSSTAAPGQQKENYNGAINVKNDGESFTVDGIDIALPTLKFSEVHNVHASLITGQWVKKVSSVTGTVNASGFRSFQRGEVLFQGVSGSYTKPKEGESPVVNLTFNFDTNQNLGAQSVGGVRVPFKRGWDVISTIYKVSADAGTAKLKPAVQQVDVIEVYKYKNFGVLGIG